MMLAQKLTEEPITLEINVKDRGRMILDMNDSAQFPLYYGIYEWRDAPTLKTLAAKSETILDIGGNIGQMALFFATLAKKVYTFEPISEKAQRLKKQISLNRLEEKIELSTYALSSSKGKVRFALPPSDNGGIGSTVIMNENESVIIEVDTITLDEFIEEKGIINIDFIKMDIEGAELFALKGMTKLLSSANKPILVLEMTLSMMKQAGYSPGELLLFLSSYGYKCYAFTPGGLSGPLTEVSPSSENYCFLTENHSKIDRICKIISPNLKILCNFMLTW
jgi:FkbM family methyltransferase